jgi:hypothetical protein
VIFTSKLFFAHKVTLTLTLTLTLNPNPNPKHFFANKGLLLLVSPPIKKDKELMAETILFKSLAQR